jgi:histidinol-phosphate aminotransferase
VLRPKPNIERLKPVLHGGINYAELKKLGLSPEAVIDFSVSTNPFGPPPGLAQEICKAPIEDYPDSESTELIAVLSKKLQLSPENLVAGSGSTELIRLVAAAYLGKGDRVIIPQPAYGDYELACDLADATVAQIKSTREEGFKLDVPELVDFIRREPPRAVFICNPNNPTGQYLGRDEIEQILSAAPATLLVLDEAYIAFTDDPWPSQELISRGNLVILRSMTKDFALAGLRLGYAIADPAIITALKKVKAPWNVSSVAQTAGIFALNNLDYLVDCRRHLKQARQILVRGLEELGLNPLPSRTLFFLVEIGDAAGLRQALYKKGLLVRDCASFGLPGYIRLATRSEEDCRRLLAEMGREVQQYRRI